ncbi:MAG: HAD family hydrolase [Kiritimatiellae bacterium]|nr:HAD family hydrolase [Kiritimatiellia bacterium]
MTAAPPRIRAVVFDFDGTLFFTADAIVHSFRAALQATGRRDVPSLVITRLIGRPLTEMFETVVESATPAEIQTLVAEYRRVFARVAPRLSRPAPGFDAAMAALHAAGIRMAIATHRMAEGARMILERFDAAHWFGALVALEDMRRPKPAPDAIWQALEKLGAEPAEAAAVGDTPDDVRAGVAAGLWSVAIENSVHSREMLEAAGAHAVVGSLADLPPLLLRSPPTGEAPPNTT